jgi:TPR repeat protein
MKQTLAMISIIGALIFGSIGALLAADFQAGFAAAQKGDYAAALREWTPLAEQGDAKAQFVLGVMYFEGQGVLQDYVTAHMWANMASMNGSEMAPELRNAIAKEMTPAQIHAAQKRAKDCIAKNYKDC